jgi:hypothetical protein
MKLDKVELTFSGLLNNSLRLKAGDVAKEIVNQHVDENTKIDTEEYRAAAIGALVAGVTMLKAAEYPVDKSVEVLLQIFSEIFGGTVRVSTASIPTKPDVLH